MGLEVNAACFSHLGADGGRGRRVLILTVINAKSQDLDGLKCVHYI